jgi:molybdate transport system substrate-binding protein
MKEAIEEAGRQFRRAHPGVTFRFNLGASGELQKQIEAGAPVDLFISAAERQMAELERQGLIVTGSRRTIAWNALTVVVPADSRATVKTASDLLRPDVERIAVGNPRTVPAGQYAEEFLRRARLWEGVRARLVLGENVRQVLEYVARGEAEAGIVYGSDARQRAALVREAFRPPSDHYSPVTYPAAVIAGSRHPALGAEFIALLVSPEGRNILGRFGFQPVAGRP